MYALDIKSEADEIFKKLAKKDPTQLRIIDKKITEIRQDPTHRYKPLKKPLHTFNRVHINTHFALIFKISHEQKAVDIHYFGHHDSIYQWRPKN